MGGSVSVSDKYFNIGILIGIEGICDRMARDGYTQWARASFCFFLFLFIEVELLYNVMLLSNIQ